MAPTTLTSTSTRFSCLEAAPSKASSDSMVFFSGGLASAPEITSACSQVRPGGSRSLGVTQHSEIRGGWYVLQLGPEHWRQIHVRLTRKRIHVDGERTLSYCGVPTWKIWAACARATRRNELMAPARFAREFGAYEYADDGAGKRLALAETRALYAEHRSAFFAPVSAADE